MADPITLPGGTQITGWDPYQIHVRTRNGQQLTMFRPDAPPELKSAVDQAEAAATPAAAPAPTFNAFGVEVPAPPPAPAPTPAAQPAAPVQPVPGPSEAQPMPGGPPADPLQPYVDEINRLGALPQTVGGGMRTVTQTQTTAPPKAAAEQLEQLDVDQQIATEGVAQEKEREGELESEGLREQAKLIAEQTRREEEQLEAMEGDRARFDERFAQEEQKLAELEKRANTEIDPGRFWKRKSTGEGILAALSIGLGGFATAFTGGQNQALAIINKFIDDDINAQLENRAGAQTAADKQAGFMRLIQDRYDRREDQVRAGMILGREIVAKQLDYRASITKSEVIKSQALQQADALRAQNIEARKQLTLQTAGTVTTQQKTVPGGVAASPAALQRAALKKMVFGTFDQELYIPGAETYLGVPMQALRKEEAGTVRDGLAKARLLDQKAQQLQALYSDGKTLSPTKRRLAEAIRKDLVTDLNVVKQMGAMSEGDAQYLEGQLGPNALDLSNVADANATMTRFRQSARAGVFSELSNKTVRVAPDDVPLAWRARSAPMPGGATSAPKTEPLR